jgi:hypothetical protein
LPHIFPNITEPLWLQRDNLHSWCEKTPNRLFHLRKSDCTHIALILRHNEIWLERLKDICLDAIDTESFLDDLTHARIDLPTEAVRVELWFGQRGQTNNIGWIVTFMRHTNETLTQPKGTEDFGAARQ